MAGLTATLFLQFETSSWLCIQPPLRLTLGDVGKVLTEYFSFVFAEQDIGSYEFREGNSEFLEHAIF